MLQWWSGFDVAALKSAKPAATTLRYLGRIKVNFCCYVLAFWVTEREMLTNTQLQLQKTEACESAVPS